MLDQLAGNTGPSGVRYRVLGPIAATASHGPLQLGGPKQRSVLAALLLRAGHVVSEQRLITTVWDHSAPTTVRGQLQTYVWNLRKLLGASAIVRQAPGYLIDIGPNELDLRTFTDAVRESTRDLAVGRREPAVARLRDALAIWDGTALGGATATLLRYEGPALEEHRLGAYEQLFEAELSLGHHGQVIAELRALFEEHPFRERLTEQLMRALHRCGRTVEALAVYDTVRARLSLEFDLAPGPRLQDLRRRLVGRESSQPTAYPLATRQAASVGV